MLYGQIKVAGFENFHSMLNTGIGALGGAAIGGGAAYLSTDDKSKRFRNTMMGGLAGAGIGGYGGFRSGQNLDNASREINLKNTELDNVYNPLRSYFNAEWNKDFVENFGEAKTLQDQQSSAMGTLKETIRSKFGLF